MSRTKRIINIIVISIIAAAMLAASVIAATTRTLGSEELSEAVTSSAAGLTAEYPDLTQALWIGLDEGQMTVQSDGKELSAEETDQYDLSFDGTTLEIKQAGTYVLSGSLKGNIAVSSSKKEEVVLVLNGLMVENETAAAIEVKKTGSLVICLAEGTGNVFTAGEQADIDENSAQKAQDASGGALYSKADTVITGSGSLAVNGYINNGIQVTKCLTVESGNLYVNAVNNGIKVKDTFTMNGGNITVLAGNDAVHVEQEAVEAADGVIDETTGEVLQEAQEAEEAAGTVVINDGQLTVNSYGDAIQALLSLTVNRGTLSLKTEGEYADAENQAEAGWGESRGWDFDNSQETGPSEKGLKCDGTITINGGTFMINSVDDAIHSTEKLSILDGELTLSTGDDGIHSDKEIQISGGNVNIVTSYEGIEANQIRIFGGDIRILAADDGFNGNGGPESFGGPGGPGGSGGQAADTSDRITETPNLDISGGTIYVNSYGDGLDSNGNITVTGGYTVVDGPTNSANGAIDGGVENGGVISISNGTVFAGGASGMAESFGNASSQCSFRCILPASYAAGTEIKIYGPDGTELFAHTVQSGGNSIVFSSPELQDGESYTLCVGDQKYVIIQNGINTYVNALADGTTEEGSSQGGSGGGPGGGSRADGVKGVRPEAAEEADENRPAPGESPEGPSNGQQAPMAPGESPEGTGNGEQAPEAPADSQEETSQN